MMGVYVDFSENSFSRMKMCHMIADTPDELLAMVTRIGVDEHWFQSGSNTPHFDIAKSKRTLAIAAGAIELHRTEFVAVMRRIRETWPRWNGQWRLVKDCPAPLSLRRG